MQAQAPIKVITEKGIYIFQMAQMYSSVCQTQGTLSWLLVLAGTLWFVPLLSRLFQRGWSNGWDNGDRTEREAADNGDAGQSKHSAHHAEAPEWFLSILGVFLIKTQVNFFGCSETRPTLLHRYRALHIRMHHGSLGDPVMRVVVLWNPKSNIYLKINIPYPRKLCFAMSHVRNTLVSNTTMSPHNNQSFHEQWNNIINNIPMLLCFRNGDGHCDCDISMYKPCRNQQARWWHAGEGATPYTAMHSQHNIQRYLHTYT